MRHQPRRAGAQWREGAPAFILDCFDNKGKTADRYTVMMRADDCDDGRWFVPYLGLSNAPTDPQGFSQWGELSQGDAAGYRYASGRDRVRWLDLPEHIRAHVIARNAN